MQASVLFDLSRVVEQHSADLGLLAFLIAVAVAYWWYSVAPYSRDRRSDLLSPEHISRPAVPGVLEYLTTDQPETQAPTRPRALIDHTNSRGKSQRP